MNIDKLKSLDREDFLNILGLESRRNTVDYLVPALALFGVGVLVGTGVGLLVAPRPGRELREDLAHRLQQAPEAIAKMPQRASEAMHRVTDQLGDKLPDGKGHTA